MEQFHVSKPIYPLLSVLVASCIFFYGLFLAKDITIVYFLLALTVIYIIFGYAKVLIKAVPMFFLIGSLIGALSILTSGNQMSGIQTLGRIMLLAYSSVIMISMSPINLTRNLVQLGVPRILTLGMLATIRFVPILISEVKQIREAMKTRGVKVSLKNPSLFYRAFLIPLLMRMISMSDIMAVSMETRGFSLKDKSRVVYRPVAFRVRDAIFLLLIIGTMVGVRLV